MRNGLLTYSKKTFCELPPTLRRCLLSTLRRHYFAEWTTSYSTKMSLVYSIRRNILLQNGTTLLREDISCSREAFKVGGEVAEVEPTLLLSESHTVASALPCFVTPRYDNRGSVCSALHDSRHCFSRRSQPWCTLVLVFAPALLMPLLVTGLLLLCCSCADTCRPTAPGSQRPRGVLEPGRYPSKLKA